jgi:hypothetical protein
MKLLTNIYPFGPLLLSVTSLYFATAILTRFLLSTVPPLFYPLAFEFSTVLHLYSARVFSTIFKISINSSSRIGLPMICTCAGNPSRDFGSSVHSQHSSSFS